MTERVNEIGLLERVKGERAFYVEKSDDGYLIIEGCDDYFRIELSAEELRLLGQSLILIADGAINPTGEGYYE